MKKPLKEHLFLKGLIHRVNEKVRTVKMRTFCVLKYL